MDEMTYKVYALPDETGRIIAINSSAFLADKNGWTLIDQGFGDKFHHAQGNYLGRPITDERGICCYKLVDGRVEERTQEEMDADYTPPTPSTPSDLAAEVAALQEALDLLLEGVTENG